jgi:hypothetical protein
MLYDELNIVRVIKIGKLMWLGQPFRMQELDPCTNVTLLSQNTLTCASYRPGNTVISEDSGFLLYDAVSLS